jgi:RND superfamily putative drug exporter
MNRSPSTSATPESTSLADIAAAWIPSRRSRWLIVAAWVLILVLASPFAGKLGEVEENDAATWLPGNAESFQVNQLQERLPAGEHLPAVVVYHRDDGLTKADQERIAADQARLGERFPDAPPSDVVLSEDGTAALYSVPLPAEGFDPQEGVLGDVEAIREVIGSGGGGLAVQVTGPAGFMTDLVGVFGGIDTTLLLATASVVAVLLLLTYRSPFLWLIPLLVVAFASQAATASVYWLAREAGLNVNGQSGGILPVLVFGAGTDYALLLIARYREELRRHEDRRRAMAFALRQAAPAILASGGTVVAGLLCLLAADLNSTRGLALVGVVGILCAMAAMLSLLPALLVIFGRRLFWPFVPRLGSTSHDASNVWSRVGRWVERRPRPIWVGTVVLLGILATGLLGLDTNLSQADQFRDEPEAITGQKRIEASYPAGVGSPTLVVTDAQHVAAIEALVAGTSGVADVRRDGEVDGRLILAATLDAPPTSDAAYRIIDELRERVRTVPDANALVGGADAENLDIARTNARDRLVVMPMVIVVVFAILALLLRAVVAPLVLVATVVLSFGAALGASAVIFDRVFGFAAVEPSVPLLGFVFLVALGIDYNIFLMSRVHEETARFGTRVGMVRGLAVTGGVITSAGLVLAATFSVLAILPLVSMTELGFLVAFGVLLDALVVRSVLVPALTFELGDRIWWPSWLARRGKSRPAAQESGGPVPETSGQR